MNHKDIQTRQGFTLIEVVIVVAVIGVIAAIILISLSVVRQRARDASREVDINQVGKAILVNSDAQNNYPKPFPPLALGMCDTSLGIVSCSSPPASGSWDTAASGLSTLLTSGDISSLPIDPSNKAYQHYRYQVCDDGQSFVLKALRESGEPWLHMVGNGPDLDLLKLDINGDLWVDILDMLWIQICIGDTDPGCRWADVSQNSAVDIDDWNLVLAALGQNCAPPI